MDGLSQSNSAGGAVVVVVGEGDAVVTVETGTWGIVVVVVVEVVVVVVAVVDALVDASDLETVAPPAPLAGGELVEQAATTRAKAPKASGNAACFRM